MSPPTAVGLAPSLRRCAPLGCCIMILVVTTVWANPLLMAATAIIAGCT